MNIFYGREGAINLEPLLEAILANWAYEKFDEALLVPATVDKQELYRH